MYLKENNQIKIINILKCFMLKQHFVDFYDTYLMLCYERATNIKYTQYLSNMHVK